ncbi:phage tail tape measure protein [Microbulbifer discodermiae]|uniref:phage tail tape measure protein n=1 Tax=Microbulbifer sp. 2201CG32-9 TaxID=3232309 RepID=UPI00345C0AC3
MADLRLQLLLSTVNKATKPLRRVMQGSTGTAKALRETRERLKELNQTQKTLDGFRSLNKDLRGSQNALQSARQRVNELAREIRDTSNPSRQLRRDFQRAQKAAGKLKHSHQQQIRKLQQLRGRLGGAGVSTRNLVQEQRRLRTETQKANRAMQLQKARLEQLARAQASARRLHEGGRSALLHGAGAAFLGQRALRGMGAALVPGLDFSTAISDVQAKTRLDKNDPRLKMLETQARRLGATTAFTATEAAQGQVFLAQAGFTPQAIRDAMPAMLNTALAGDMALPQVADIVSNISGAFGIEAKNTQRVADVLTATSVTSNTNLEMLGETMKYVGPQARAMGADLETAAAMAGLLGNIGIQSSMAGTNLREVLNRVGDTAGMSGKALASIGVSAADANGDLRNIVKIIADVGEATKNIGSADRAALFKQIFGQRAGAGMADLVTREGQGALSKYAAQLHDVAGTAERVAKVKMDNLEGDLKSLQSATQDLGITLFKSLEPSLRKISSVFTGLVRRTGEALKAYPQLTKVLGTIAAIFAVLLTLGGALVFSFGALMMATAGLRIAMAAAAPVLSGLGTLLLWLKASVIPALLAGFKTLFVFLLTNPIGWVLLAIAGAAFLLMKYWQPIKAFFAGLWGELVQGVRVFWQGITHYFGAIWEVIAGIFTGDGNRIRAGFAQLWTIINDILGGWPDKLMAWGGALIDGLVSGIKAKIGDLKNVITGAAGSAIGFFKDKLGIRSPSRVFAGFGRDTMDGFSRGINARQNQPLRQLDHFNRRLRGLGAGLTIAAATMPAVAIDQRPPLSAQRQAPAAASIGPVTINIYPAPGMDAAAIASLVREEIQKLQREREARRRASLRDYD